MHVSFLIYIGLLLVAAGLGVIFKEWGIWVSEYMSWYLMGILFISGLKIKGREIWQLRHKLRWILQLLGIRMLVIPVVVYVISGLLISDYQLAFVLLVLTPVGMAAPLFTTLLNGNGSITLALTVLSALITPFILPFAVEVMFRQSVAVDSVTLIRNLVMVLVLPVIAAELVQMVSPTFVKKTSKYFQRTTYALLLLVFWGTFALHGETLLRIPVTVLLASFVYVSLFLVVLGWMGWVISKNHAKKDRIAITVSFPLMNYALAIYLGNTFFPNATMVVLITVLVSIPWNLSVVILDLFFSSRIKSR